MSYATLELHDVFVDATLMADNAQPVIVWSGTLKARNVKIAHAVGGTRYCFVIVANSICDLADVTITAGNPTVGVAFTTAAGRAWNRGNADFVGAVTPYSVNGQTNFGIATLNGTTPVTLPFSLATSQNRLMFSRAVAGGTLGHISGNVSSGLGATIVSNAAEMSTVFWEIQ
jgi:hypothetical protein